MVKLHLSGQSLLEWAELAIVVGDVGQAPEVEDLARGEGAGRDEELTEEADATVWGGAACSGDEVGGSGHYRAGITLDVLPYLERQLSQDQNRGKHCCSY